MVRDSSLAAEQAGDGSSEFWFGSKILMTSITDGPSSLNLTIATGCPRGGPAETTRGWNEMQTVPCHGRRVRYHLSFVWLPAEWRQPCGTQARSHNFNPTQVLVQIFIRNILLLRGHYCRFINTLFICWRWHKIAMSTPNLWCHLGSNISLWPLFARRSKTLDLFIHMYGVADQYHIVSQEELDTMFQDATFHERIRETTFDGSSISSAIPRIALSV